MKAPVVMGEPIVGHLGLGDPEFEAPPEGCDIHIRWHGLTGVAGRPSIYAHVASQSWYELSPVDGGRVLAGVARLGQEARSSASAQALRETCWALALAGQPPASLVAAALADLWSTTAEAGVVYCQVDPPARRVDLAAAGGGRSVLVIEHGEVRVLPLPPADVGAVQTLSATVSEGATLMLLAHEALHRDLVIPSLQEYVGGLGSLDDDQLALHLCGQVRVSPPWRDAAVLALHFVRHDRRSGSLQEGEGAHA